jgi:Cu2+-exporting ATPase
MEKYLVTGMSCAACSARVEKAVSKVDGVTSCSVSLLTNSMGVEGSASPEAVIQAVEKAGYGASLQEGSKAESVRKKSSSQVLAQEEEMLKDRETPRLRRRLIWSVGVLLVLMYLSMGYTMASFPVPGFLEGNPTAVAVTEMLLAIIIMIINGKFFTSGYSSLFHGAPNMDTLVALGSTASFGYSLAELYIMLSALNAGNTEVVMSYSMNLYFEAAAMIPTLITVGKLLEAKSKGRTTDALKSLMKLAPKTAVLIRDGKEVEVPIDEVRIDDIFIVHPGENIPVDGVILEGTAAVNEAALTGESLPVDKTVGDEVSAATINASGYIRCRATRVGEDTTLSQIIQMVSDAAATKAPLARIADRVSGIFVPTVIGLAILTFIGWMIAGRDVGFSIARAISVLVISCPCALGLATPVAIMVGNGMGAKHGILYKTAESLEETGRVEIVALDKTGTLTNGTPKVTDVTPAEGVEEDDLLQCAVALESKSDHPLARAVSEFGDAMQLQVPETEEFEELPGRGLKAVLSKDHAPVYAGNIKYISTLVSVPEAMQDIANRFATEGKTPLAFARSSQFLGFIAVADTLKEDSPEAVRQLRNMGIRVVMLTGDNEVTAKAVGQNAGVDEVIAGVLPDGKQEQIRLLSTQGKTAMVGDGINDAPALTQADVGIAIGAGTDVAVDAADVVLMKSRLLDVAAAIRLSRATIRNIHENLGWAFIYNIICIPLAMGLYGIMMKPVYGAAAMALSSFCVCMNALRLNTVKVYDDRHDRKIKPKKKKSKEEKAMEKTIDIKGMMCNHCEMTVQKALEALPQVDSAVVSHTAGTAVITLNAPVEDSVLKKAVEDKDYEVVSIH